MPLSLVRGYSSFSVRTIVDGCVPGLLLQHSLCWPRHGEATEAETTRFASACFFRFADAGVLLER